MQGDELDKQRAGTKAVKAARQKGPKGAMIES